MDGVQFFLGSSFIRKDAIRISGQGSPGRMGFPVFFSFVCVWALSLAFFTEDGMSMERIAAPSPRVAPIDRESPLWQAAEGMEANFLKEMLRNMRKTVQEGPEMQNNRGFQIFRGMLDDHYAETAARTQGIGLAEIIVKQVQEMQQPMAPRPVAVRNVNESDVVRK